MIDRLLYLVALALVRLLQALPLGAVVRLGRSGGALAYFIDGRHRSVALRNLTNCFGDKKSVWEIKSIAREPGFRTKLAVWSRDEKVDPVGACVGLRGQRVKNIVRELNASMCDSCMVSGCSRSRRRRALRAEL